MSRLPYLDRKDLAADKQRVFDGIVESRGSVLRLFQTLLHTPDAAERVAALGEYLRYGSPLDPAVREIAILTTARELNVDYEWTHHVRIAREAGVDEAVIDAIRSGKAPMGIPAKQGVFAQAARELVRDRELTDRTYQAVEHLLGPLQTVDLIVLVGYYSMIGSVLKTMQVELEGGVESDLTG